MTIPNTQPVNIQGIPLNGANELFAFAIQPFQSPTYLNDFIANLDNFLPAYVFSKRVLEIHSDRFARGIETNTPLQLARKFLQITRREYIHTSGDLGELLLYLFAKNVKNAHKLVSRLQSKGSVTAPLPGRDGIYFWQDPSGDIYLLTGEAKVRQNSNDGLRDAQSAINDYWQITGVDHEVRLASNFIRDELSDENYTAYEAYFIDGTTQHQALKYKNIILVGYSCTDFAALVAGSSNISQFEQVTVSTLTRCFANQQPLVSASVHPSIYCFIPFESVDAARTAFAEHNNLILA